MPLQPRQAHTYTPLSVCVCVRTCVCACVSPCIRLQQYARDARKEYAELGSKDLSELKSFVKGLPKLLLLDRLSDLAVPVAEVVKQQVGLGVGVRVAGCGWVLRGCRVVCAGSSHHVWTSAVLLALLPAGCATTTAVNGAVAVAAAARTVLP